MSGNKSHKCMTLICVLVSILLITFGVMAFLPSHGDASTTSCALVSASGLNLDMFKSMSAFKDWLGAVPYYIYLIIAGALLALSIIMLCVALFKKARFRRNDVNVLILVGDDDEKVDTTVFKEHYAVVVVSKPSSLSPVQPRILSPIVPLENNKRYIPIPKEDPQLNIEQEEIVTIQEEQVEQIAESSINNQEVVAPEKPVVTRIPNRIVTPRAQEQAPIVVVPPKEEEVEIEEPLATEEQPPTGGYYIVDDEPLPPDYSQMVMQSAIAEPQPEVKYEEPIAQLEPSQSFEEAYSDVASQQVEEEQLYDEDEFISENFEEVAFDEDEFNVSPIIINNEPSVLTDEMATDEDFGAAENSFDNSTQDEEEQEMEPIRINNSGESAFDTQVFSPQMQSDTDEIAFEEEEVVEEVAFADMTPPPAEQPVIVAPIIVATTQEVAEEPQEEDNALDIDINATANNDNGGVYEDKDILKLRYKSVDMSKRLCRAEEDTKGFYSELKNALLSYKGVKSRISQKFDTFNIGRFIIAKLAIRGNVINLYLALPSEQVDDKYFTEDVGDSATYGKTPTLHKVKSKRGCKYGVELIHELLKAIAMEPDLDFEPIDFAAQYPPENIDEKKKEIANLMSDTIFMEDTGVLSDEDAIEYLRLVKSKNHTINKFNPINKFVVYLDDLRDFYEDGDTVTIANLVERGALPEMDNIFLEVRGKGYLDRRLNVEAHSFDIQAIKMITLTNGDVIQYK